MQRTLGHCDTRRNPDNLRFTKRIIDLNFPGQLDCENIYDVLYSLETGKLNTRDLPCLRVISHGGQLWTLDNKLLYIYRISPKVKRISVVQVSRQRFLEKFLRENSAVAIERLASAEFFPEVSNCGKYPPGEPSFRSSCPQSSMVKHLEKENTGMKRLPAPKSSSSARSSASSKTVTSQISSENTEAGTSSTLSVVSECVHPESKASITSSTDLFELSSEDALDSDTCYPAVRSMTSEQLHLKDTFLAISAEDKTESANARIRRSSFTAVVAERPSTSQASSRFSPGRFPSATGAITSEQSSEETKRELRSIKTAPSGRVSPDKLRENFFRRFSSRCRPSSPDIVSVSTSAKVLANFRDNHASQCFSTKFQDAAQETPSQNLSSKLGIGEDEPDDAFKLEAFVIPDFFYTLPSKVEESAPSEEEIIIPITEKRNGNRTSVTSPTPDRLDRSVSSCSSSTERPMLPHPLISGSEGGLHGTVHLARRSGIGLYGSPIKRASVSAGGTLKCNLPAEQDFRIPKQTLLKHMKKAFFSVC